MAPLSFRRSPLTRRDRELYHAAGSIDSNDLVALLTLSVDLLERAGLERRAALRALVPLMRGTLDQIETLGPARALTGPVVRGDVATLDAHLARLSRVSPAGARVHRLLSHGLIDLAGDRLSRSQVAELRRRLRED